MAKTYVLDRVAADLARGFTHPAIQRLSSLVAAYPNDLDLRRRLAAVHRRVGNRIQAGRWDYLTVGADSGDTAAFERAFPSAVARLRAVRWPHRAGQAATSYARTRLAKLIAAAEAERPTAEAERPTTEAERTAAKGVRPGVHDGGKPFIELLGQWRHLGRSWDLSPILLGIAAVAAVPLGLVGLVTVLQWIVQ